MTEIPPSDRWGTLNVFAEKESVYSTAQAYWARGVWNDLQRIGEKPERVRNWRMSRDHSNSNSVKICQNTEKSSERHGETFSNTHLNDYQLTLE